MKKIKIYIEEMKSITEDFTLYKKGGNHITAICAGKEIEWNKRGIIESSLQLNKSLGFTVIPKPGSVTVVVFQKSNSSIKKEFILKMDSDELFVENIERGMRKIEAFILSIEEFFKKLIENSVCREIKYTIGGK